MAIVDELITLLGFKTDTSGAEKYGKSINKVKDTAKQATIVLAGMTAGILYATKKVTSGIDAQGRLMVVASIMIFQILVDLFL